jgi:hypothetical protein
MESQDIKRLKEAGISGETISLIISEKVIETCAFRVNEIIELKRAGFDKKTMQKIIKEGSFLKDDNTIVYGKNIKSLKMTTITDVIELKNNGLSEETIRAIIDYSSQSTSKEDRERAWEMLKNMGILIEKGKKH